MKKGEHTHSRGGHTWCVMDLWEATEGLPVIELPLAQFENYMRRAIAWQKKDEKGMSVWRVMCHAERIQEADLSRPIILDEEDHPVDGSHRLCKAWMEGHKTIKCVRLAKMPPPIR